MASNCAIPKRIIEIITVKRVPLMKTNVAAPRMNNAKIRGIFLPNLSTMKPMGIEATTMVRRSGMYVIHHCSVGIRRTSLA